VIFSKSTKYPRELLKEKFRQITQSLIEQKIFCKLGSSQKQSKFRKTPAYNVICKALSLTEKESDAQKTECGTGKVGLLSSWCLSYFDMT
jgi:hypothetical protein